MYFPPHDLDILRRLAGELRLIAESGRTVELEKKWIALNRLENDDPLILISPEGAWREYFAINTLECRDAFARELEEQMKRNLFLQSLESDQPYHGELFIAPVRGESDFGVVPERIEPDEPGGAWKELPPLKDLSTDLDKLRYRELAFDRKATEEKIELAKTTLGDLLTVSQMPGYGCWSFGMTRNVISLISMEKLLFGMFDEPENIHRLMRFLSDEALHYLKLAEEEKLLYYNAGNNQIGSGHWGLTDLLPGPAAPAPEGAEITPKELWGLSESQETVGVSPEMFGEFIWPYQKRIMEHFGLVYYGCCEPVEGRFRYISELKNLRAISVSPWSDPEKCAELYQKNYVLCHKPNPGNVCVEFNEKEIRADFSRRLRACRGLNNAFILKDTNTISSDFPRFKRFVEIFREEVDKL